MRRGLIKDATEMLDDAIVMVGGTFPPDEMDEERARRIRVKREVLAGLRLIGVAKRAALRLQKKHHR